MKSIIEVVEVFISLKIEALFEGNQHLYLEKENEKFKYRPKNWGGKIGLIPLLYSVYRPIRKPLQ